MRASPALCLVLCGCVDFLGFPSARYYQADPYGDDGPLYSENDNACDMVEREPNDGEERLDFSTIGAVLPGQDTLVCGELSELGLDPDGYYSGDLDLYLLEVLGDLDLSLSLGWQNTNNLDMYLFDAETGQLLTGANYFDRPERLDVALAPGSYTVYVAGTSGPPTDYELRLEAH